MAESLGCLHIKRLALQGRWSDDDFLIFENEAAPVEEAEDMSAGE